MYQWLKIFFFELQKKKKNSPKYNQLQCNVVRIMCDINSLQLLSRGLKQ